MEPNPRYERLQSLHQVHGKLTADVVVADAADPDSPLHGVFEWDDTVAAFEYRKEQARHLIRSYRIVVRKNEETVSVRAFVHEPATDAYSPIDEVWSDNDRRSAHLLRLRAELIAMRQRLTAYEEFDGVVAAIDEYQTTTKGLADDGS